ncbi:HpcH/HpaI aldolase/citrate lyase family protein [Chelativorans sp. J32]|uniref:HpcH/HpaI aldolase family protein n=1 Tax=Chelativorans sp. J32 TaxID=935840 RepID=UPI0004850F42|nr:aldolase/citrate lyase family protein [Chelativorans sp. J32]
MRDNALGAVDELEPSETGGRRILQSLQAGKTCIALGLRNARTTEIAKLAASVGYDLVWVDMEHAPIGVESAAALAATAASLGVGGWVRIREGMTGLVGPLLDGGAGGIICPHIQSAVAAREAVAACRFPPKGGRSQNALLPQLGYVRHNSLETMRRADNGAIVQLLIETPEGVDRIDEIAAEPGVDMIAIGLNDLSVTMGRPGEPGHPDFLEVCKRVANACGRRGVVAVAGGTATPELFSALVSIGFAPLAFAGMDTEMLADNLSQRRHRWLFGETT